MAAKKEANSHDFLEKLAPKEFIKILDACMQTLRLQKTEKGIKVPEISLSLANGVTHRGVVTHYDYDHNAITLFGSEGNSGNFTSFIKLQSIVSITLHNVDLCPEFLDKLAGMRY